MCHHPEMSPVPYPVSWIIDAIIDKKPILMLRVRMVASENNAASSIAKGVRKTGCISDAIMSSRAPVTNVDGSRCTNFNEPGWRLERCILAIPELKTCLKKDLKLFLRL